MHLETKMSTVKTVGMGILDSWALGRVYGDQEKGKCNGDEAGEVVERVRNKGRKGKITFSNDIHIWFCLDLAVDVTDCMQT